MTKPIETQTIVEKLRIRAAIRRKIARRPDGQPDRIADVCEEAADEIERLQRLVIGTSNVNEDCELSKAQRDTRDNYDLNILFGFIRKYDHKQPNEVIRYIPILHDGWELDNSAWIVQMVDGSLSAYTTSHGGPCALSAEHAHEKLSEARFSANAIAGAIQQMGWDAPKNQQSVKPPYGYLSWLDYAVQCMDTRSPNIDLLLADLPTYSREEMQAAVEHELRALRRLAGVADTYGARND